MRIQHFQQRFGEQRKVVVQPLVHTRRQQGKRFDQSLDVRVFAYVTGQLQAAGDLGITLGKVGRMVPQKCEFPFVVGQQIVHVSQAAKAKWRAGATEKRDNEG